MEMNLSTVALPPAIFFVCTVMYDIALASTICDPLQEKGPNGAKIRNCVITTSVLRALLRVDRYQDRRNPSFRRGVMAASVSKISEC